MAGVWPTFTAGCRTCCKVRLPLRRIVLTRLSGKDLCRALYGLCIGGQTEQALIWTAKNLYLIKVRIDRLLVVSSDISLFCQFSFWKVPVNRHFRGYNDFGLRKETASQTRHLHAGIWYRQRCSTTKCYGHRLGQLPSLLSSSPSRTIPEISTLLVPLWKQFFLGVNLTVGVAEFFESGFPCHRTLTFITM